MEEFTMDQVTQLREIERARVKNGAHGLRAVVQELIQRLTSGGVAGKAENLRVAQAKRWFDRGAGRELQIVGFDEYLATIPEVPTLPEVWMGRFDRLVLVEGRLPIMTLCRLAGLKFSGNDRTLVPFDPAKAKSGVRWMWCQDGQRNRNRKPTDCRTSFLADEIGLDAIEGVAVYVGDPTVINGHVMDLPGSVSAGSRHHCAYIGHWGGGPGLYWFFGDGANPRYGSASRGECGV